jgi:hypothetical protein
MDKDYYEDFLDDTLTAFGLIDFYHSSELVEKKEVVRKLLNFLVRFRYCFDCIAFEKSVLQSMVEVDNQVPCILHMHKKILEKIMMMVYCTSLDEVSTSNKEARKIQAKKISDIINTSAFDTVEEPGTHKVPFDSKTGKVVEVEFDDYRAKTLEAELPKILQKIKRMEEYQKSEWIWCAAISSILETLGQKQLFTNAQIVDLQLEIDIRAARWVALCGKEGMTNYTHLLCDGHVTYYLSFFHNRYPDLNQGWEYLNSRIKYVYHHRTNRGGSEVPMVLGVLK